MKYSQHDTKKIMNALRLGVVPDILLMDFSVGRDYYLMAMNQLLGEIIHDQISSVKFLAGPYGTGKSFNLALTKQLAIKQGFIVSTITVSKGFSFSKIDDLYRQIMSHLTIREYDNVGTDFEEIFEIWLDSLVSKYGANGSISVIQDVLGKLSSYNQSFNRVLISYIRAKINKDSEIVNIASSWIKGEVNLAATDRLKIDIKGTIDRTSALDILKAFVKLITLMGYSGLVVLVDELELAMSYRVDIRNSIYLNIRQLIDLCGDGGLHRCLFMFSSTNLLLSDSEKGFPSYEALSQRLGHSITTKSSKINVNYREPIIYVDTCTEDDYHEIGEKICTLHQIALSYSKKQEIGKLHTMALFELRKNDSEKSITLREYIKKIVEILDIYYENQQMNLFKSSVR